jgi:hypothetical protein
MGLSETARRLRRQARMTQPVRLTLQDLSILREALERQRTGLQAAVRPFGLVTTWQAENRLDEVWSKVIAARCDLKRRQHPDYNPAGDSECVGYATDEEHERWNAAHPVPDDEPALPPLLAPAEDN